MNTYIRLLVDYGKISDNNKQKLIDAYNDSISSILENKGQQVTSGNVGDLSFNYGNSKMTILDFSLILKQVLDILEGKKSGITRCKQIKYIR